MPCFNDNMSKIKEDGFSIYLYLKSDLLNQRLQGKEKGKRPLLRANQSKDQLDFIRDSLTSREQFYFQSNLIVDASNSPEEICRQIQEELIFI